MEMLAKCLNELSYDATRLIGMGVKIIIVKCYLMINFIKDLLKSSCENARHGLIIILSSYGL